MKPCLPTCGITATPLPAKAGKPFTVDLSGSRVAAGVKGGVKSAKVEVVDPKGAVVDTFEMGADRPEPQRLRHQEGRHPHPARGGHRRGRPDLHERLRGAGGRQGRLPIFVGAYFGKERLDPRRGGRPRRRARSWPPPRSAPRTLGFGVGVQPKIGDNARVRGGQLGIKLNVRGQRAHRALRRRGGQLRAAAAASSAAGLSWWDIGKDSGGIGLLAPGRLRPRQGRQVAAGRPGPRAVLRVRRPRRTTTRSGAASASGRTAGSSRLNRA